MAQSTTKKDKQNRKSKIVTKKQSNKATALGTIEIPKKELKELSNMDDTPKPHGVRDNSKTHSTPNLQSVNSIETAEQVDNSK